MNFTKPPSISSVVYVINFLTRDTKVRFRQAEVETAFAGFIVGQSQQTNIPDHADPAQPRIIFAGESKAIAISQVACQLQMDFSKSGIPIRKQLEIIRKNLSDFSARISNIFDTSNLTQSGLIVDLTFANAGPAQELHEYIADRFYKGAKLGNVVSAQFTVGFEIKDLFVTLSASPYEQRQFDVNLANPSQPTFIDINSMPIVEHGLGFKIDVNDRPRHASRNNSYMLSAGLIDQTEKFITEDFQAFSGLSVESQS
jgi:hypothetical protein